MTTSRYYKALSDQLSQVEMEASSGMESVASHALEIISCELEHNGDLMNDLLFDGELDKIRAKMDRINQIING